MHHARLFLTFLFMVVNLAGAKPGIAAEADASPPLVTRHEVSVLRQVAIALAAGSEALQDLRGPPIENSNLDRLKLATPGMECGIARTLMFVACHGAALNKKEAEAMFTQIIDDAQAALPADVWTPIPPVPKTGVIRSSSYYGRKSNAQIDVDMVVAPTGGAEPGYFVRVFGWTRF
jgi:hypothetical protein